MQYAANGRANDGDLSLGGFGFHLRQHFIARRKYGIEIVFDFRLSSICQWRHRGLGFGWQLRPPYCFLPNPTEIV